MKKTIGIFAHVDSGKTTFCERILYKTGSFGSFGRTDKKTSALDTDETEKSRGITVFSHQGEFVYNNNVYYIIDTPGHTDFSPEAERSMGILDYAVLLIDSRVRSYSRILFRLFEHYKIPCFIFINKADMESFDLMNVFYNIKNSLSRDCFLLDENTEKLGEFAAERDYEFLEKFIEEKYDEGDVREVLKRLIKERKAFPVMAGSALKNIGTDEFLENFDRLTYTCNNSDKDFEGKIFKIRHDKDGRSVTFMKIISGRLNIKDDFCFDGVYEKVNEIRFYNGDRYICRQCAEAGDIVGVCGFSIPVCGDIIKKGKLYKYDYRLKSVLEAKAVIPDGTDRSIVLDYFRIMEKEEPTLSVNTENDSIIINTMGKIQLEILERIFENRFGVKIEFGKPDIRYKETIKKAVTGYGHYEPLKHYAEAALRLEPTERNSGISFTSECHVEHLSKNYQNLIKTHIFEKEHKGVLTGSPITDIRFVLVNGISHLKHTEGGDFREATYRAVRQGLMKAESVLLEPFYDFVITVNSEYVGRVMSDIQKMRGSFENPVNTGSDVVIKGRGPVETFMEYGQEISAFTKGEGSISLIYGGMDICEIADKVIEEKGYNPMGDVMNTPNSIFCKKGAGFNVNWYDVESYAHTLKR